MTLALQNPGLQFERANMATAPTYTTAERGAEPYMLCLEDEERKNIIVAAPKYQKVDDKLLAAIAGVVGEQQSGGKKSKKSVKHDQDADLSSGPPSPPESGSTTPRLTIAPVPARFRELIPPANYGCVELHKIFRSSFPLERNIDFVRTLRIRSMLTLVDTVPNAAYTAWLRDAAIKQKLIVFDTNKDGQVNTTYDSLCEALLFVLDGANYPLYIHCNKGKHRTGCVIACLRKIQRVPMKEILDEYMTYAGEKWRVGDVKLIEAFDPEMVYTYAKAKGLLDGKASGGLKRLDSNIVGIDMLAAALAAGAMGGRVPEEEEEEDGMRWGSSAVSIASSSDDDALEIKLPGPAMGVPFQMIKDRETVQDGDAAEQDTAMADATRDLSQQDPTAAVAVTQPDTKRTKDAEVENEDENENENENEATREDENPRLPKAPKIDPALEETPL